MEWNQVMKVGKAAGWQFTFWLNSSGDNADLCTVNCTRSAYDAGEGNGYPVVWDDNRIGTNGHSRLVKGAMESGQCLMAEVDTQLWKFDKCTDTYDALCVKRGCTDPNPSSTGEEVVGEE